MTLIVFYSVVMMVIGALSILNLMLFTLLVAFSITFNWRLLTNVLLRRELQKKHEEKALLKKEYKAEEERIDSDVLHLKKELNHNQSIEQ